MNAAKWREFMVFEPKSEADWVVGAAVMVSEPKATTAAGILAQAADEMANRADTYDKPEGERSMGATVAAFKAVTGIAMSEQQGWQFMELLKMVRSNQGGFRADSFVDGAAYAALAGEAAARDVDRICTVSGG